MVDTRKPSRARPFAGFLTRWLPLLVIIAAAGLVVGLGWHRHLSLKTLGLNYATLQAFIDSNLLVALTLFILVYVAIVALSLPGASIMTLAGGLLFGWQLGTPATVIGATAGATVLFLVARSSFCEALAERAGPAIQSLQAGCRENGLCYMLFLRLVPAFPFVVVNLAAAVLGVPLGAYVLGTVIGIIPGSLAYTLAGAGLGSVIEAQNVIYQTCLDKAGGGGHAEAMCPYTIETSALITKELIAAFILLGLVALIPVAIKKWKARNAAV